MHISASTATILAFVFVLMSAGIAFLIKRLRERGKLLDAVRPLADTVETRDRIRAEAKDLEARVEKLRTELKDLGDKVVHLRDLDEISQTGFSGLRYDFGGREEYERRLEIVQEQQKMALKDGRAAVCDTKWTVQGSAKKGERMTKEALNLMLRAFNGECDALVSRVKYNNVDTIERRIHSNFEAINKLGKTNGCYITSAYRDLRVEELHLVHGYQERKQAEAEEQREIRERLREEEKALRELQRAQEDAAREEARVQTALEKVRRELEAKSGAAREALQRQVEELTLALKAASERKQRAISQAELTSCGHVYIISNIGSFGEDVYKIGLTRRWDPQERIDELGDASVPFPFDVHAIVFCENAPQLEKRLHAHFSPRRMNLVNSRKEYFRVTLPEIEIAVRMFAKEFRVELEKVRFTLAAEAREFRESESRRDNKETPRAA